MRGAASSIFWHLVYSLARQPVETEGPSTGHPEGSGTLARGLPGATLGKGWPWQVRPHSRNLPDA